MPRIRNVSPWGALDVPLLGRIVEHGEDVEVEDDEAAILLDQPDNWQAVEEPQPTEPTGSTETPTETPVADHSPEAPQSPTEPQTTPEGGDVQ